MDAEHKAHARGSFLGLHSVSSNSQGSAGVDDEPQEQSESEDEIDHPKPLRK